MELLLILFQLKNNTMNQENFIYRNYLNTETTDEIVDFFWKNSNQHLDGASGSLGHINKANKDSRDLYIHMGDVLSVPFFQKYEEHLTESVNNYIELYPSLNNNWVMGITEPFGIQHYQKGGGYKAEHCERTGNFDKTIKRVLVFMTYLNDVEDGGTHFKYYNHTEKAEKGKTIIWPSDWTHTHNGQISENNEKIISTGWVSHRWD
jgi:prolyl 4-hydroxylase